jgi:hypothetical protein
MLQTLTPEHPFFVQHAEALLFDDLGNNGEDRDSLEDIFEYFKEAAASMVSTLASCAMSKATTCLFRCTLSLIMHC